MYLIVYTSRAKRPFTHVDLVNLRAFSASVNRVTDITGLLVYDGKLFIQAIEGDVAAVKATMKRITKDPRHDNITYIERRETEHRQFGQFSTQFRDVNALGDGADFLTRVKTMVGQVELDSTKAAFIGFASLSLRRWFKG
jgi:hypothetical protein